MRIHCWLRSRHRPSLALLFLAPLIWFLLVGRVVNAGNTSPKLIILELHGMKQGIIAQSLDVCPHFRELIKGPNNEQAYVHLPQVFTAIPAASVPGITSMYTGLYPQRTGVVSTIWFNRRTTKISTMISYRQQEINRVLASNKVKTLFDYVGEAGKYSMTTMLMVTKGADWSVRSGASFWGNASLLGFFRNGRWIPDSRYIDQKTISAFLTGHIFSYHNSFAGIQQRCGIVPDVMVIELLGTDLFTHYPARDLRERDASIDEIQKHYLQTVLDPLIGRLIQAFKRAGCYEDIIFLLVSEHGFTQIEKHIDDKTIDRSLRQLFDLPGSKTSKRKAEGVIMLGACTKEIYLKNRQSQDWMDPPRLLADVKLAVDLVLENADIQNCMETLVIRQYPGERDDGIAERDQWWVFDWRSYLSGAKNDPAFLQALFPLSSLEKRFELGEYVVQGLRKQYTRTTAPDIKLINKKGYYFERDFDKYAHHGSYYPSDCIVSFWVAGPGVANIIPGRHTLECDASILDLVPMVTYLLGMPVPNGLDGKNPLMYLQGKPKGPNDRDFRRLGD